jgi:hypothetical protein
MNMLDTWGFIAELSLWGAILALPVLYGKRFIKWTNGGQ